MAIFSSLIAFVVALVAGGFAIFLAGLIVVDTWNVSYALITAFVGGLLWALAEAIGHTAATAIVLILWIVVIDMVYPGDWKQAMVIGFIAWAASMMVLVMIEILFAIEFGVFGIPGF